MTRKPTRNSPPRVVAIFVGVLTLLIAAAVLGQVTGRGRPSGNADALSAQRGGVAPAQAERPSMLGTDGAVRFPAGRSYTKRHAAVPMDSNSPLFLPAVAYDPGGQ